MASPRLTAAEAGMRLKNWGFGRAGQNGREAAGAQRVLPDLELNAMRTILFALFLW